MAKRTSFAVWDYFEIIDESTPNKATCKISQKGISRGSSKLTKKTAHSIFTMGSHTGKTQPRIQRCQTNTEGCRRKRQKIQEQVKETKKIYILSRAQPTLIETLDRQKKWEFSQPDQMKGDTLLAYCL